MGEIYCLTAPGPNEAEFKDVRRENLKGNAELRWVQAERDLLNNPAAYVAKNLAYGTP